MKKMFDYKIDEYMLSFKHIDVVNSCLFQD